MIHPNEIVAARGLIGWTQTDLSQASGLSINSIVHIEKRITKTPKPESLAAIQSSLEKAGVEFIEGGVRKIQFPIKFFEGKEGFIQFYNLVYEETLRDGGEILISDEDEEKLKSILEEWYDIQANRMGTLLNFRCRSLIRESSPRELQVGYCQYLPIPDEYFSEVSFYIFGHSYAIFLWKDTPKIILINDPDLAEAKRKSFDQHWKFHQGAAYE